MDTGACRNRLRSQSDPSAARSTAKPAYHGDFKTTSKMQNAGNVLAEQVAANANDALRAELLGVGAVSNPLLGLL